MSTLPQEPQPLCLQNFPVPLYGSVMGLAGLAIAASRLEGTPVRSGIGFILLILVSIWFLILSTTYLIKLIRYPREVRKEFDHPVRMNFFPAISISILLLTIGFNPHAAQLAGILCLLGVILHLVFLLRTLRVWFFRGSPIQTFNPAWFIPVVGTLLVPVAATPHLPAEVSWFFFSIGIVFWVAMLGMTLNRVIFHQGLPPKLLPTLFILIAPPAVAFLALHHLTPGDELSPLARILYFHALFMVLMVLCFVDRLVRIPFFLSWWAYTFPLAAVTLASFLYAELNGQPFFRGLGIGLLCLLIVVIGIVGGKTIAAARAKTLCLPEE